MPMYRTALVIFAIKNTKAIHLNRLQLILISMLYDTGTTILLGPSVKFPSSLILMLAKLYK